MPILLTLFAVTSLAQAAHADPPERPVKEPPVVVAPRAQGGPVAGAPVFDMREGEGLKVDEMTVQGVYLPFNFTFSFGYSLNSRTFWPSYDGRACVNLRGTGSAEPTWWGREIRVEMWNAYGTDTRVGATVRYSVNGNYYGYCWTGLYPYHEHYFRLVKDWGGSKSVWGDGWAST
ncbi:hypothetical protein ACTG9Q_03990 [Actinokineospora sp. 24-640]